MSLGPPWHSSCVRLAWSDSQPIARLRTSRRSFLSAAAGVFGRIQKPLLDEQHNETSHDALPALLLHPRRALPHPDSAKPSPAKPCLFYLPVKSLCPFLLTPHSHVGSTGNFQCGVRDLQSRIQNHPNVVVRPDPTPPVRLFVVPPPPVPSICSHAHSLNTQSLSAHLPPCCCSVEPHQAPRLALLTSALPRLASLSHGFPSE